MAGEAEGTVAACTAIEEHVLAGQAFVGLEVVADVAGGAGGGLAGCAVRDKEGAALRA